MRLKCEKPEDIDFTLTITMKASEWEAMREQLSGDWPSWKLTSAINSLLSDARKIYWHDTADGKEVVSY